MRKILCWVHRVLFLWWVERDTGEALEQGEVQAGEICMGAVDGTAQ